MSVENIQDLSLTRLNELMGEAGHETYELLSSTFIGINASEEAQYEITYDSPVTGGIVTTHVLVDIDLQEDTRLMFSPIVDGDLNLRRTEEEIEAASQAAVE